MGEKNDNDIVANAPLMGLDDNEACVVLGLMSGTSGDGIDAAVLHADGVAQAQVLGHFHKPHDEDVRALLRQACKDAAEGLKSGAIGDRYDRPGCLEEVEELITRLHAEFARDVMAEMRSRGQPVRLVGFHGHTVLHAPQRGITIQLGDGDALAQELGETVVWDMRANDMEHGGQGAPLAPAWHVQLARRLPMRPVMFVNIGGVANVTWIGGDDEPPHAFDTGPGNALMDDLVRARTGLTHDENGALAAKGTVNEDALHALLAQAPLHAAPPRSFDRDTFSAEPVDNLSTEDALATLCRFTAHTIARASDWLPGTPEMWIVCGGGRHNRTLMRMLAEEVDAPMAPAEALELDGDHMEAQAWAWLAVRALKRLPLTWPTTTGVDKPRSGGFVSMPRTAIPLLP